MATAGAFFGQSAPHPHQPHQPHQPLPKLPSPPHGKKRRAENSLETEQRLSKRLDLLNLDNNGNHGPRLYIPVAAGMGAGSGASSHGPTPHSPAMASPSMLRKPHHHRHRSPPPDTMLVEDTPHRIYIHDLNAELSSDSESESDESHPIFLPDIEKHIGKIPAHVLNGPPDLKPTAENQLILYSVPSSLTVPEEQDRVRRAILEARARIREKQASPVRELGAEGAGMGMAPPEDVWEVEEISDEPENDPDAMDIDG